MDRISIDRIRFRKGLLYAVSIIGLALFYLTGYLYMTTVNEGDTPGCRIVFMGPSYARIQGFDESHTRFASKYSLYLYREQGKDPVPQTEEDLDFLKGTPVLFVPGNAGSFRQIRSIAAESANLFFESRGQLKNRNVQNLDFFSADFNEDLTAFHGQTLLDQVEFLNDAVKFILGLYENRPNPPKSVIILSHSMGGVVARGMLTFRNYLPGSINTIITLASPHAAAPLTFDGDILKTYSAIDRFWYEGFSEDPISQRKNARETLANVSLISITGGLLDSILPADYTTLGYLVPPEHGFTVYSTGIPGVWTSIDHLAIVWCGQLRRKVLEALLEVTDLTSPHRTYSLEERMKIFRRIFLTGFEDNAMLDKYDKSKLQNKIPIKLDQKRVKYFKNGEKVRMKTDTPMTTRISMFKTIEENPNNKFSLLTSLPLSESHIENKKDLEKLFSVLLCLKKQVAGSDNLIDFTGEETDENIELECVDISSNANQIPASTGGTLDVKESSIGGERKPFYALQLNSSILRNFDIVLINEPETAAVKKDDFFIAEICPEENTKVTMGDGFLSLLSGKPEINLLSYQTLSTTINVPGAWSSVLAYKLVFHGLAETDDKEGAKAALFQPFIRQWREDPYETKWHANLGEYKELVLNMHGIAPYTPFKVKNYSDHSLNIDVWIDPFMTSKPYILNIEIDLINSLRLLVLRYRLAIVALCVSCTLLAFLFQFKHYHETGHFPSLIYGLSCLCSPKYLCAAIAILALMTPLATLKPLQKFLNFIDPVVFFDSNEINLSLRDDYKLNSFFLGLEEQSLFFIGPLFYIMGIGVVFLSYYGVLLLCFLLIGVSNPFRKVSLPIKIPIKSLLKNYKRVHFLWMNRRLVTLVFIALMNLIYLPYQFSYVVGCIIQAIQVLKIATDRRSKDQFNFHLSLFIFMLWVLPINVPVLMVLVHNFSLKWSLSFSSHHNILQVVPILIVTLRHSTNTALPHFNSSDYLTNQFLLAYIVFYCLVYGIRHTFWLHDLLNIYFTWLAINYTLKPSQFQPASQKFS